MTEAMTLPAAHSAGAAGVVQGTRDPEQVTEMAMTDTVLAWDFESEDGRPGHGDGRFASERLIDALNHAKSPILRRVRLGGIVVRSGDRCAATERTSLWTMDGTDILRTFARQCAFDVIKVSGWQAPLVVMEYLTTGNEKLRSAAREATREATRNAARGVAWPPAWAATKDVAWEAAWETGWYATWAAAWEATRSDAKASGWEAARDAAREAQNVRLTAMVMTAAKERGLE